MRAMLCLGFLLVACQGGISPEPTPDLKPVPTVTPTPTPEPEPKIDKDLAEIINVIEHQKVQRRRYVARPVLSSQDTKKLKGKSSGIKMGVRGVAASASRVVDLRNIETPIKDQGQEGLCTAFAVSAGMEMLAKSKPDLSEKHLWSKYQQYDTTYALSASKKYLITTENVWPYNGKPVTTRIKGIAKTLSYSELRSWDDVYKKLDERKSVILSAETNTSWSNPYKGILRTTGTRQGGHAIKVSGYFDTNKGRYLIIKNSWGTGYGDRGYVYLPELYCNRHWCAFHVIEQVNL